MFVDDVRAHLARVLRKSLFAALALGVAAPVAVAAHAAPLPRRAAAGGAGDGGGTGGGGGGPGPEDHHHPPEHRGPLPPAVRRCGPVRIPASLSRPFETPDKRAPPKSHEGFALQRCDFPAGALSMEPAQTDALGARSAATTTALGEEP